MIRMVAIDLDDTLLDDAYAVSAKSREAIGKAVESGVKVCLVSGRSYSSVKRYNDALRFTHLSGSLNGAYIHDPVTDEPVHSIHIDRGVCGGILKLAEASGIHVNFYHGSRVACSVENRHAWDYMQSTGVTMEYVGILSGYAASFEAGKLLLIDEREKLEEIRRILTKDYGQFVNVVFSKPQYLEIYDKAASKGQAVKMIAAHYGIPMDQVMALGDGENDMAMLQSAGIGVAMGNAAPHVKAAADYVTLSNREDGVAHALWRFVLNGGGK